MIAAALLLAIAGTAPAEPSEQITVTARDRREQRSEAVDYVRAMGVALGERPVARWIDPVCPQVTGIAPRYATLVEARLRETARLAEVPLAPAGCRANILVSFAANRATADEIIASGAKARRGAALSERRALENGASPVRWWYSTELRGADGSPMTNVPPPAVGTGEGGVSVLPPSRSGGQQLYGSSIISTQSARALRAAVVVINMNLAEGVPLDAVASYAALVALAEIRADAPPPPGSILALFDQGGTNPAARERDLVFLRALYRLPLDRVARQQRGRLVRDLVAGAR